MSSVSTFYTNSSVPAIKLAIKVNEEELCRRVRLNGTDSSSYFAELQRLAVELASQSTSAVTLTNFEITFLYNDLDGDSVWIATNEDLLEAIDHFAEKKVFKVFTTITKKEETKQEEPKSEERKPATPTPVSPSAKPEAPRSAPTAPKPPIKIEKVAESVVDVVAAGVLSISEQVQMLSDQVSQQKDKPREVVRPPATPPAPSTTERPFIHGRHTCDGCLATPIIGIRYHATNLPDYDLCGRCKANYQGNDVSFTQAVAERDRPHQDRWARRHARCNRRGAGRQQRRHPPPQAFRGRRHAGMHPPPPPHHGMHPPPPPHHGMHPPPPPHHGMHPPPPPHHGMHPPPPPHHFGMHPPPPPHHGGHHCPPPMPHHISRIDEEVDLAVKEAIRRSLEDMKVQNTPEEAKEEPKEESPSPVPPSAPEEPSCSGVDPPVAEPPATPTNAPSDEQEEEEIIVSPEPKQRSVEDAESPQSTEFSEEAEGEGEVAAVLAATLDKVATAIDDFTFQLERESSDDVHPASTDSDEDSAGWDMVSDGNNQQDIARAAEMIGSALYSSGMQEEEEDEESSESESHYDSVSNLTSNTDAPLTVSSVPSVVSSVLNTGRWAAHLAQLHELGFTDDRRLVEILESLEAANIGSNESTDIPIEAVVDQLSKDW